MSMALYAAQRRRLQAVSALLASCAAVSSTLWGASLALGQVPAIGASLTQPGEAVIAGTSASFANEFAHLSAIADAQGGSAQASNWYAPVKPWFQVYNDPVYARPTRGATWAEDSQSRDRYAERGTQESAQQVEHGDVCATPGDTCSSNWSGMEDWGDNFSAVSATWTVPAATATSYPSDSSTWIGLDGDPTFDNNSLPPLVQMGTDSPSDNGSIYYEAWYELLPGMSVPLYLVQAGDTMQAEIMETSPGRWSMAIADLTANVGWTDSGIAYSSPGLVAEWVEEAPTICRQGACGISPLQDFGQVSFSGMSYGYSGTDNAHAQLDYISQDGSVQDFPTATGPRALTVTYGAPPAPAPVSNSFGGDFTDMAVDPSTGNVFVSSGNTVTEIGTANGATLGQATVPGAGGIVVHGSEVYVASTSGASPGIYEIATASPNTSTPLASLPNISPLLPDLPRWIAPGLVYADGSLWTTESGDELVQVNTNGTPTAFPTVPLEGSGLIGDPANTDQLFSYNSDYGLSIFEGVDLGPATPTVDVPATGLSYGAYQIGNLRAAAVSPNGTTLVVPALSSADFEGFSTSTLASTGMAYPGVTYPITVAMTGAGGGLFAGGGFTGTGDSTVFVYKLGAPADQLLDYSFPQFTVAAGGLAFSPDGTKVFVVTTTLDRASTLWVLPLSSPPPSGPTAGEGAMGGAITAAGQAQSGVCIEASGTDNTAVYYATTADDGTYAFDDMVPGHYTVFIDPTCDGNAVSPYAVGYYQGQPDPGTATGVAVLAGETVTGVNAQLTAQSSISGVVNDGQGNAGAVCVDAFSANGHFLNEAITGPLGQYTVDNLPVDNYVLVFVPNCLFGSDDAVQFNNNAPSFTVASQAPVQLTTPGQDATANEVLAAGATVNGHVTAGDATDQSGVCVYAYATSDTLAVSVGFTSSDGSYSVSNLPAGDFRLVLDPTCGGSQPSSFLSATLGSVSVPSGQPMTVSSVVLAQSVPSPSITTPSLPPGSASSSYFAALMATGGTDGLVWGWAPAVSSTLPPGLYLSPGGVIYGTPTSGGTFSFWVEAFDMGVPRAASPEVELQLSVPLAGGGGSPGGGGGGPPGGGGGGLTLVPGAGPVSTTTTSTSLPTATTTTTTVPSRAKTTGAARPVVTGLTLKARVSAGSVALRLHCAAARCTGKIRLWHGHLLLGAAGYGLQPGQTGAFAVTLSKHALRLVAASKENGLRVTEGVTVAGGERWSGVLSVR
jgi:hypothetical protein